jgi:transcriptional regulator with XRE-family HTH domain
MSSILPKYSVKLLEKEKYMKLERLKEIRKERNLKQCELATILDTTQKTISDYENGVSNPDLERLIKIADYFNISTDYLLGRKDY